MNYLWCLPSWHRFQLLILTSTYGLHFALFPHYIVHSFNKCLVKISSIPRYRAVNKITEIQWRKFLYIAPAKLENVKWSCRCLLGYCGLLHIKDYEICLDPKPYNTFERFYKGARVCKYVRKAYQKPEGHNSPWRPTCKRDCLRGLRGAGRPQAHVGT